MAINKHGLKIKGVKKAVGEMVDFGKYAVLQNEVAYDKETGEIWVKYVTKSSWTDYDSNSIITFASPNKMTMQEVIDLLHEILS